MKIIDVSKHNGNINWTDVKNDGIEGAIIRAGFGKSASQKDPTFETNYKGASAAGLHIGAYWYSYALNVTDAELEAKAFLECIGDKRFDLPVFFDIEDKTQVPLGKKVCTDIVDAFMGVVEAAGYFAGVYSFDSFFGSNLDESVQKKYSCWVARVENVPPKVCREYGMHQYTWKGSVSGISGAVDISYCYKDFPSIIKSTGLNGYSKADTYKVVAEISGIEVDEANKILVSCHKLGMISTVTKEKE